MLRWEKKIRHFSSEEKTKIVLALLQEDLTITQLSSKYGVSSKNLQNWKRRFLENASFLSRRKWDKIHY